MPKLAAPRRAISRRRTGVTLTLLALTALHCHEAPRARSLMMLEPARASLTEFAGADALRELARQRPLDFFRACRARYDETVRDYRCTFIKQERVGGQLGAEQEIAVAFRESPFSVDMRWVRNPGRASHATYVAGRWLDGQKREEAVFRPAGLLGTLTGDVRRPIHSDVARAESRRTLDQFGFKNTLDLIIKYSEKGAGVPGYSLRFVGEGQVDGRPTYAFERTLPYTGDERDFPDRLLVIHVDQEWLVPSACVSYADDQRQQMLGSYVLADVAFNVGLSDADFDPAKDGP